MKAFRVVLIAAAIAVTLLTAEVGAKTLKEHSERPVVRAESTTNDGYEGLNPIIGRNVGSVFLTDIINIFVKPNSVSFIALFVDLIAFIIMPILGGFMMSSTTYNYDLDYKTYQNADISKADMYASQMQLMKTSIYNLIGKPNFFD